MKLYKNVLRNTVMLSAFNLRLNQPQYTQKKALSNHVWILLKTNIFLVKRGSKDDKFYSYWWLVRHYYLLDIFWWRRSYSESHYVFSLFFKRTIIMVSFNLPLMFVKLFVFPFHFGKHFILSWYRRLLRHH